jgi:hypothetical protein
MANSASWKSLSWLSVEKGLHLSPVRPRWERRRFRKALRRPQAGVWGERYREDQVDLELGVDSSTRPGGSSAVLALYSRCTFIVGTMYFYRRHDVLLSSARCTFIVGVTRAGSDACPLTSLAARSVPNAPGVPCGTGHTACVAQTVDRDKA